MKTKAKISIVASMIVLGGLALLFVKNPMKGVGEESIASNSETLSANMNNAHGGGGGGGGGGKAVCGDGVLAKKEKCDDGNLVNNDGCSDQCEIEIAPPVCGDGNVDAGEQCDDGNLVNNDGCSDQCTLEQNNIPIVQDTLENYVNGLYDKLIPKETEEFVVPTQNDMDTFQNALQLLLDSQEEQAAQAFTAFDYKITRLQDLDAGKEYLIVEENSFNQGDNERGWGALVINTNPLKPDVTISSPHSRFETNILKLNRTVFEETGAQYLLVNGSHRHANAAISPEADQSNYNISDSAHTHYIYNLMIKMVSTGSNHKIIENHGFKLENHNEYPQDTERIVSKGYTSQTSELQLSIAAELEAAGFTGQTCGVDEWNSLCSTKNTHGRDINAEPQLYGQWIHIEHESAIRGNEANFIPIAQAIDAALN